jgi:hypothetical protein
LYIFIQGKLTIVYYYSGQVNYCILLFRASELYIIIIIHGKSDDEVKKTTDDYDIAVRSLQFEMKGQVSLPYTKVVQLEFCCFSFVF